MNLASVTEIVTPGLEYLRIGAGSTAGKMLIFLVRELVLTVIGFTWAESMILRSIHM
jgi:hypothetical protein